LDIDLQPSLFDSIIEKCLNQLNRLKEELKFRIHEEGYDREESILLEKKKHDRGDYQKEDIKKSIFIHHPSFISKVSTFIGNLMKQQNDSSSKKSQNDSIKVTEKKKFELPEVLRSTSKHRISLPVKSSSIPTILSEQPEPSILSKVPLLKLYYEWMERQKVRDLFRDVPLQIYSLESNYIIYCNDPKDEGLHSFFLLLVITHLLVASLSEDTYGLAQQRLVEILECFLLLEMRLIQFMQNPPCKIRISKHKFPLHYNQITMNDPYRLLESKLLFYSFFMYV
jgi:hypothetical protein